MKECDVQSVGTIAGSLVNEADALLVAHGESFAYAILNLEGNMVNALATVVEELLYGAFGASGLQELQLHFAHLQEGGLYLLVFYNFSLVNLQTENVLEEGQYSVDALNGNAQVLNA